MAGILIPYNTGATVEFVLIGSATAAFSAAGSGSLVGTNVQISKDGGAFATSTNTGTSLGSGLYQLVLTTSEASAKRVTVLVGVGTLGTVVEHQAIYLLTYGNASAMYPFDFGAAVASANLVQVLGTAAPGSAGTLQVNLIPNQATATIGTALVVSTGTVTTVTNVVTATGTLQADVVLWKGTAAAGTQGVPSASANIIQILSTAVVATAGTLTNVGTVGLLLTGTVTTVINVASANVVQILGTAAVATAGTFTNVGTVTTPGSANLTQILGTAVVGTQGTLTNVGTVGLLLTGTVTTVVNTVTATLAGVASANVVQILGTAAVATAGTFTNVGTVTTPGSANLTQILGTAVVATAGTLTNVGTVGTVTGTVGVDVLAINGTALAAQLLARSAGVMASGSATGTISSTAFETDLTLTRNDRMNGRIVLFLSGTMQFEGGTIGDFRGSAAGTLAQITISTLSAVPADGVTFIIV